MSRSNNTWCYFSVVAIAVLAVVAGCGTSTGETVGPAKSTAQRSVGAAGPSADVADTQCDVVLRSVGRVRLGPGFETTCSAGQSAGPCLFVWRGAIEVSAAAATQAVKLLYKTTTTQGQWYTVDATPSQQPATPGFVRYAFVIDTHTPAEGMSTSSLMRTTLAVIPYLQSPQGGRIFDHNRVADPLAAYELTESNGWEIGEGAGVCPAQGQTALPTYVLDYPAFRESLRDGPLQAGRSFVVDYDARRLRDTQACLGSHAASSATTIMMGYRFDSDPTPRTATIETYVERYGYACQGPVSPCIDIGKQTPTIQLPADAKRVELWFYCVPGFGDGLPSNWKYDSNFGSNYVLPIEAHSQPGRRVDWAGRWQVRYSRSGVIESLPEPFVYTGFSNLDPTIEAHVYAKGITDQASVDTNTLKAYVESDLFGCVAGGALTRSELPLAGAHQGPYGNDALFRFGLQAHALRCPKGEYRYRFLFSADGGSTFRALGNAASTDDVNADDFRHLSYR